VRPIDLSNYRIDSAQSVVFCGDRPLDCVETARKATAVSRRTFRIFEWVYFYAVDLLAHLFATFKKRQFTEIRALAGNLIADQKKFLKLRTKVSEFVKNHFKVISKNIEHLDEAEVICLGETHGTYRHMSNNGKLIDILSEPDSDLVLVEHDENLPTFRSDQAKYVKRPLPIKGWDKLDEETLQEISSKLDLDPMSLISMIFFGRLPIQKLEEIQWANQKIIDDLPARNQHMCQTIEENRGKGRRIYVIAGSGHLSLPKGKMYRGLDVKPQEEAFQETLTYLKTTKHAILIPK
jgi:hypothetical protein